MNLEILKKRLSTYRTKTGRLTKVGDEVLMELLVAWEQWSGPANGFYSAIGIDHRKAASMLGKAKRLKREGFPVDAFKEVLVEEGVEEGSMPSKPSTGELIELRWDAGRVICFPSVDPLLEFLKKAA